MKIRMIYLAAGNSRRFGSNKLYCEVEGKPMYRHGLEALEAVLERLDDTALTVVTEFSEIREYVSEWQKIWKDRISVVGSPEREKGISYSIRAGLALRDADYYLFCVADQPWICPDTIIGLIQKTVEGGYTGGFAEWNGVSGNPAVFSKELLPELLALEGDTGGKKILLQQENVCTFRAQSAKEMEDIDRRACVS